MNPLLVSLWQLSRFHTRESWLVCFPAIWGFTFAFKQSSLKSTEQISLLLVFNWICMTLIHGTFCTWNDFVDADIDAQVERTKGRPLPSKRCTLSTALTWFAVQCLLSCALVYASLGALAFMTVLPACFLATIYPFAKRYLRWPQFVLAVCLGWFVFVGWSSISSSVDYRASAPLFMAYVTWSIYFDSAYGLQDIRCDEKAGVGSLPQLLGRRYFKPFMTALAVTTVLFMAMAANMANCSLVFWILGVGVWAASIPHQIQALDVDNPSSGGYVFGFNIKLGLYITVISLGEMIVQRVVVGL